MKDGELTFVGLKSCSNTNAPGITDTANSAMTDACKNWKEKAVAPGSDGASLMFGELSGVYALLKQDIPHLIKVHYIAHQLELAYSDAVKAVRQLEEAKDILQGM